MQLVHNLKNVPRYRTKGRLTYPRRGGRSDVLKSLEHLKGILNAVEFGNDNSEPLRRNVAATYFFVIHIIDWEVDAGSMISASF
jgi:hypothetical protein